MTCAGYRHHPRLFFGWMTVASTAVSNGECGARHLAFNSLHIVGSPTRITAALRESPYVVTRHAPPVTFCAAPRVNPAQKL